MEIKSLIEYEKVIIVFEDLLGSSNSKYIDQFIIRGSYGNLDKFYLSESYFDLTKRTKQNKSFEIIPFNQTLKDVEKIFRDVGGYDMSYDEFKQLCRKSSEEENNYLRFDGSKKRDQ